MCVGAGDGDAFEGNPAARRQLFTQTSRLRGSEEAQVEYHQETVRSPGEVERPSEQRVVEPGGSAQRAP